ncbi:MAG TPA: hypothetical protein VKG64_16325 [Methylomirabilota bacterium]|nr:hypothetical protein [Methylomirabilota bacterium]
MSRPAVSPRRPFSHMLEDGIGSLLFRRVKNEERLALDLRADAIQLDDRGVIAAEIWETKRKRLRDLLLRGDPSEFLRWDVVRSTMVKRGRAPVAHELRHLRRRPDWKLRWRPALRESTAGSPRPFHLYPRSSGNLIHQAYHLCRFEEATGLSLPTLPYVVEFGGGYGSLCRLFHQMGFAGTYVIFDLPEVSALQRFFLRSLGITTLKARDARDPVHGAVTVSDLGELRRLLRARPPGLAAFVAQWSLGETPVALRRLVLPEVAGLDAYLLGYTERFEGIDNRGFFKDWRATLPGHAWHDIPLPHLHKAEWYLFGVRGARA